MRDSHTQHTYTLLDNTVQQLCAGTNHKTHTHTRQSCEREDLPKAGPKNPPQLKKRREIPVYV